jgi:hypothetical protein
MLRPGFGIFAFSFSQDSGKLWRRSEYHGKDLFDLSGLEIFASPGGSQRFCAGDANERRGYDTALAYATPAASSRTVDEREA